MAASLESVANLKDHALPSAPDFAAMFAAFPGAVAVFAVDSPRFTVLAASDALLAVTHRPREAVVGRPLADAFPNASPEDTQASGLRDLRASLAAAVRTGEQQHLDRQRYDLQRPDGTWETRYWDAVNIPVRGPDGAVRHVLHQTADVTAQVRGEAAQAQAASAEHRAQGILERMSDSHCVLDRDFQIVGVNAAAERLLGRPRQTLLGRSHWEVFPASVGAPIGRAFRRVVAEGIEQHLTHYYVGEGYDLRLEVDAYPTDEGGVAMFWRDVTQRVPAEAALRLAAVRDTYRLALTDALRGAGDPVEAQAVATRVLGDHLRAGRVMYGDADPGSTETFTNHREYRRDPLMPSTLGGHRWDDFGIHVVTEMRAGRTIVADEVRVHPGHSADELAAYEALGIRAYVAVPLVREGQIVAFLAVNHTTPHAWTAEEVALTEETAERTWAAVERAHAEEALRASEVRQSFLLSLSDSLRPLRDPLEVQRVAVAALGLHLKVNRALYFEVQADGDTVRTGPAYLDGVAALPPLQRMSDFGVVIAQYRRNESSVAHDVLADPLIGPTVTDRYAAIDVRAGIGVPLLKEGRIVSIIGVHQAKPRMWTATDVALIKAVAERTWEAVERARAEAALCASEEMYRALFSEMDEAFAVVEVLADETGHWHDFRFLEVNPAFMRHTGMPCPVGRTAMEVLGTPNPRWVEFYGRAVDTGVSIRVQESELALGRVFDLNIFRLGGEGSRRIAVLFTDITERKRVEKDMRRNEERQRYLVRLGDAMRPHADPATIQGEAVRVLGEYLASDRVYYVEVDALRAEYVVEREWRLDGVASHARRYPLADWPMPSLANGRPWVVCDVDTDPAMPDDQRASYRANDISAFVVVPLLKNGQLVSTLIANATSPRDWTVDEIELLEDTAERTWAVVERARAVQALKENDRHKDEFLAMLGHELRNPLASIRTVSALLDKQLGTRPEYQPLLGVLTRQTMQLTRLVDDLLDVARLTQGRVALKLETVECGAVIEQALETVHTLAAEKSHQLLIHRPGEKLYVLGDCARLVQSVTNLLHNAIKYTDPHGTITLAVSKTEQELVLSVQDTGIGISAELLPHVFDLFVQSERSLDRSQGGLGIGLSVVRRLVGLHHGTLQAHSAGLGQGSIFEIRLPRISAPDTVAEAVAATPGAPRRILIVDDNRDAADTLALLLTFEGHHVDVVYCSTDVLDRVAQQHPDVVFLDIGMPVMDGYAVARAIRAHHGNALRLIALTGYGMPDDRKRTAEAGFDAHLVKPVDVETLLSNVAG